MQLLSIEIWKYEFKVLPLYKLFKEDIMKVIEKELKLELKVMHKQFGFGCKLPKLKLVHELDVDGDCDVFGACYQSDGLILINYALISEWGVDIFEVLQHEYAHYITSIYDNDMHGDLWKMSCERIGHDYVKHGYPKLDVSYNYN